MLRIAARAVASNFRSPGDLPMYVTYASLMRTDRRPRCRCRVGPANFEVRAKVERFAEPAVLLLLAEQPSHGYEIAESLEGLLEEGRVDFGNLYRLLRSLEGEGLVSSSWNDEVPGPLKRTYELTGEGAALLGAWAASLRAVVERIDTLLQRYDAVARRIEEIQNGENNHENDPARRRPAPAG